MNKVQFNCKLVALETNLIELQLRSLEKLRSVFNFVYLGFISIMSENKALFQF